MNNKNKRILEEIENNNKYNIKFTNDDFLYLKELVYKLVGINLHNGKKELVRSRLYKRLLKLKFKTFKEYCNYLKNNPEEIFYLIDRISTNFTLFFRESSHFDFLKEILPIIIEKKLKNKDRKVRIWSAGCSSGEEAYSIAMIIYESIPQYIPLIDIKILATDIAFKSLETAKKGIYPYDKLKENVPLFLRNRYFEIYDKENRLYKIRDNLKKIIYFKYLNLIGTWPFKGKFDIIFCRNVMIYFDQNTKDLLINKFIDYLNIEGFLFLGHVEVLINFPKNLKHIKSTIYQKVI